MIYYVDIDISKYKHNFCIITNTDEISTATILSEYGDISNFSSPNKMLALAGLEPSIIQS